MTDSNPSTADLTGAPSAGNNLRQGLTGSPAAKLKLMVLGAIALGIVAVVALGSKKAEEHEQKKDVSRVAVSEVSLKDDDPGASAANPEVDSLINQVETQRQKAAITEGNTYVAPVPDLDSKPPPPPKETSPQAPPADTVSYASQQTKLAALQGLDERLNGSKSSVAAETQFQAPKAETAAPAPSASGASATPASPAAKGPVKKQYPAGTTVWMATMLSAIDSDRPGPVKARIEQGPFAGAQVLGSYEITGRKYVAMSFTRLIFENVETPINAIAVDPNNGLAALEGDVNNHWGERLVLPTLAAAVSKYAEAATFGGSTAISAGTTVLQQPILSNSAKLEYALGSGVQSGVTPVIQEEANSIKRQVTVRKLTSFGLMLVEGL